MMTTIARMAAAVLAAGVLIAPNAYAAAGGESGNVDTSALPEIDGGNWLDENPYRGSKKAMQLGKAAYDGNCARCHGIDMISGGIAPDLRELGPQYDEYFLGHIRNGVQRNGVTYMPAFEGVLDQKTMWAIRSYVDKRHYEYKDKDLSELYAQWDESHPGENDKIELGSGDSGSGAPGGSGSAKTESDRPTGADKITGGASFHMAGDDEPSADATADGAERNSDSDTGADGNTGDNADAMSGDAAATTPDDTDDANADADTSQPDRLAQIEQEGALEIAVYRDFPPWSYSSDSAGVTGIDIEIGKALAERLGVSFSPRVFTADETMGDDIRNQVWKGHYLGGGVADAMLHVGMAEPFQRANDQATFIAPYYNETMGFAYNAKTLGTDVDSPLALKGKKIGVQLDSLGDYFLTSAFQGQLRNDVEHFDSVPAAMKALNSGEVSAVMAPVGELSGAVEMLDERDVTLRTVELTGMYQTNWDIGVAIKAGNSDLAAKLRDEMQAMRDDGTIQSIFQDFGVPYRAPLNAG